MAAVDPGYELPQAPQPCDNVRIVQQQLRTCTNASLPQRYVWPAEAADNFKAGECVASKDESQGWSIPVVDFTGIGDRRARKEIARKIGEAAKGLGFFQALNTSVPPSVVEDVSARAREFFGLPVEEMEKAKEPPGKPLMGYGGRHSFLSSKVPWTEYLSEFHNPVPGVQDLAKQVWEDGNPKFCSNVTDFCNSMEQFGLLILELLAEDLNLPAATFAQHFQKPSSYVGVWRFNYYTPCPVAPQTVGQGPHRDPTVLTILKQDEVPGLQVRNGGEWMTVEPLPGALVINIGDFMQAWSNDIFRSAEHRVRVNESSDRLTIVYFISPPTDLTIHAPAALVAENKKSVFKPFTYPELMAALFKNRVDGDFSKSGIDRMRREGGVD